MDKSKVDLNAPAFGPGSQMVKDLEPKEELAGEEISEETTPQVEEEVPAESEEESKVPYSRFKKFHDQAKEAEKEAEYWRNQAELYKSRHVEEAPREVGEPPEYWVKLYGDSDASKEAWTLQERANQRILEEAKEAALEAARSERIQESERMQENLGELDSREERLSSYLGRGLTEKEQSSLLDITDEFTPKDEDGNYLGPLIPEEKAWEIYEMRNNASKSPKTEARNKIAALSGSQTQGEPSTDEKNKSFNPMDWGAWRKRL